VPEQLGLEQGLGNGRAVDRDEPTLRRPLCQWIARATSSLPEPLSPRSRTGASVSATTRIWSNTPCMALERPRMLSKL
jgi:hypothetical protein